MNSNKKSFWQSPQSKIIIATSSFFAGIGVSYVLLKYFSSKSETKKWLKKQNELYEIATKSLPQPVTSEEKEIFSRINVCETIIHMANFGYLANTIQSNNENKIDKFLPTCRIIQLNWKPPVNLPYINIGTNKLSRKYNDLINNKNLFINNNVVLTISDELGAGYVSLFGKIILFKDRKKTEEMFPLLWKEFFPFNPNNNKIDPNFVVLTLCIEKIEMTSYRLGYDTISHRDWKPFILKRKGNIYETDGKKVEWIIADNE